jgi:hypothetical protein
MQAQPLILPKPGVPADHGVCALGLIMQLAGTVAAALTLFVAAALWLAGRVDHPLAAGLALGLCLVRARLHRRAGRALVYGGRADDPARAVTAYVGFGLAHALAICVIASYAGHGQGSTAIALLAALALWPLVVLAMTVFAAPAVDADRRVVLGEDRGLEGAAIVMTALGACGALSTGAVLLVLGGLPARHLEHGWGPLVVLVFVLLLVRSALHVRAGLGGLRARSFDRPVELVTRYVGFAAITAVCVGGVLVLLAMAEGAPLVALASVAVASWLLFAWPAIVKRFFYHRQFTELLDGDRVLHQRAPDAGTSALGWLLAGHATLVAALTILAVGAGRDPVGRIVGGLVALCGPAIPTSPGGLVASGAVVALEAACAVALIGARDHRRAIATLYALVAGAVAGALAWPIASPLRHAASDLGLVLRLAPTAIQIAIPAVTLLVVHRAIAPTAVARYRSRAA